MLLLTLQIVYGFIMAFAHMGYDGLHPVIAFNTAQVVHTNLLVVCQASGFMGAAYYIIPEESELRIGKCKTGLCTVDYACFSWGCCNYWLPF